LATSDEEKNMNIITPCKSIDLFFGNLSNAPIFFLECHFENTRREKHEKNIGREIDLIERSV